MPTPTPSACLFLLSCSPDTYARGGVPGQNWPRGGRGTAHPICAPRKEAGARTNTQLRHAPDGREGRGRRGASGEEGEALAHSDCLERGRPSALKKDYRLECDGIPLSRRSGFLTWYKEIYSRFRFLSEIELFSVTPLRVRTGLKFCTSEKTLMKLSTGVPEDEEGAAPGAGSREHARGIGAPRLVLSAQQRWHVGRRRGRGGGYKLSLWGGEGKKISTSPTCNGSVAHSLCGHSLVASGGTSGLHDRTV